MISSIYVLYGMHYTLHTMRLCAGFYTLYFMLCHAWPVRDVKSGVWDEQKPPTEPREELAPCTRFRHIDGKREMAEHNSLAGRWVTQNG